MAKELPFFKFEPSEWMAGRIQRQPLETQAVFINLCCKYWHKLGELSYEDACLDFGKNHMQLLTEKKIIGIDSDYIFIKFLDVQLEECAETSKKNSLKGLKSAEIRALRKLNSTTVEPQLTGVKPNSTEEKRKEEKRKDLGADKSATYEVKSKEFYDILKPFTSKYSKKMLREFYNYWTEKSPKGKKMRFEKETVFDHERRLITWASRAGIGEETKPPAADDFKEAQFWKDQMLPAAWLEKYNHQIETNPAFKQHFQL